LGGYVKMSGENPMEPATGDPGEFMSSSALARFLIGLPGIHDVALAVGLLTGLYVFHFEQPAYWDDPATTDGLGWQFPCGKVGNSAR